MSMWRALILTMIVILSGCSGNQAAKPKSAQGKPATTGEEIPADPYAAMEAERNAVKESLAGRVSEVPDTGESASRKVYSGVVQIAGRGSAEQTIILKTNRGSFVLVGDRTDELLTNEGRFITVMGRTNKNNPVAPDYKDLEQLLVDSVIRQKIVK